MKSSLIITIYRLQNELPLLLSALAQQSELPGEIIFAEDDINEETIRILELGKQQYPQLRMKLVQHEDRGFRKAEILNKAVSVADYEKLIFLDGDCLPHKHYVRMYLANLSHKKLLNARAVYLNKEARKIFCRDFDQFVDPGFLKITLSAFKGRRYGIYWPFLTVKRRDSSMNGQSWSCMRDDYIYVNGFDERFCDAGYGYEDIDMSHRLNRSGVMCFVPKFQVIYYHFGPTGIGPGKQEELKKSKKIIEKNDSDGIVVCERGFNQWRGAIFPAWKSF